MNIIKLKKHTFLTFCISMALTGCVITEHQKNHVTVETSYLNENKTELLESEQASVQEEQTTQEFTQLYSIEISQNKKLEIDLSKQFSGQKKLKLSANELPLNEFVHYTLGDLLKISYVVDPKVKSNVTPVTISLQEEVTEQRMFQLVQNVLAKNDVSVATNDGVFYVYPSKDTKSKSDVAFGFGRNVDAVPMVSGEIIQMIPMNYNVTVDTGTLLRALVDAGISVDTTQSLVRIQGSREQVLRALDVVELIDVPAFSNKAIAIVGFDFIDSSYFIEKVSELLEQDGISTKQTGRNSSAVNFVPLEHLGKVIVFATSDAILNRIKYWNKVLDKPATGAEQSFYIYHPKYARASDIGASLAPLLKGATQSSTTSLVANQTVTPSSTNRPGQQQNQAKPIAQSFEGDGIRLVVDERANALIFYSTGQYYQELQPIIKKLDIMPKQIMMEVVIAEVKLTGSFAKGVQFALQSGTGGNRKESFSFNSKDGFNYSIVGLPGSVSVNLNQTDGLVNVLSRPTLLVRDGVAANISVGDDIPTIGSTTSDPINGERETTTIEYRKTGVDLSVTPTINAQGTVIMTIEQKISNISPGSDGGTGTPAIFERTIGTEVVAGNGQTVLLGGLISQNNSEGATSIPLLGQIPVLGHLFRSDTRSTDKTELVVLVTPKIVQNNEDWLKIKHGFKKGLENLSF